MKIDPELVEACYRQLTSKDFRVDDTGITFSITPSDRALIQGAGEKKLKKAFKLALARKTADDVVEVCGLKTEWAFEDIENVEEGAEGVRLTLKGGDKKFVGGEEGRKLRKGWTAYHETKQKCEKEFRELGD